MIECYLALGSNLGDRFGYLNRAVSSLYVHDGIDIDRISPVYESEAHTRSSDDRHPPYLNAVIGLQTTLEPRQMLSLIRKLERAEGRPVHSKGTWTSRTIDLDILAFGSFTVNTASLKIPHPRLDRRLFVLLPWHDIAPDFRVPAPFHATVSELLEDCTDPHPITQTSLTLQPRLLNPDPTHG